MATSQELLIVIDAATEQLRRELKQADTAVAQASSKMDRSLTKVDAAFTRLNTGASAAVAGVSRAMGALGIAIGGAELVRGVGTVLTRMQEIERTAQGLGVSVKTVQELTYTFEQFGVASEDVTEGLAQLSGQAVGALSGSTSLIDTWGQLGITVDELRGKDPAELFRLLAKGIAQTEDPAVRLAAASSLLGEDLAGRLIPLLVQGEQGLDKFAQKAEKAGRVVDEKTAAGASRAAQAFHDLKTSLGASFQRAVAENASKLEWLARAVNSVADAAIRAAAHPIDALVANPGRQPTALLEQREMLLEIMRQQDISAEAFRNAVEDYIKVETQLNKLRTLPATVVRASRLPAKEDAKPKEDAAALAADQRRAAQIIEATRTPLEQYRAGVAEAQRLFERGQLSAEQFQRQMRVVKSEFDRALEGFSVDSERLIPGLGTPEEARAKAQAISEEVRTPLEALQAELARTQQLFDQGFLPEEDWRRKTAALQQQIDALAPGMRLITGLADDFGAAVAGAFEQAVADGDNLRGVVRGLAQDLQRLVLRQTVTQPLAGFVSSFISGAAASAFGGGGAAAGGGSLQATGGLTAALGSALPARAEGGPVLAGRAYLVGERGPEPFIPAVNGTILPNRALGGVRINAPISIHAPNADRQAVVEIARIAQQLPALVVSTITQDVARDGPISRSLRR